MERKHIPDDVWGGLRDALSPTSVQCLQRSRLVTQQPQPVRTFDRRALFRTEEARILLSLSRVVLVS